MRDIHAIRTNTNEFRKINDDKLRTYVDFHICFKLNKTKDVYFEIYPSKYNNIHKEELTELVNKLGLKFTYAVRLSPEYITINSTAMNIKITDEQREIIKYISTNIPCDNY